MRRIKQERYALQEQVANAARGIHNEPAWPAGAPTEAEVQALADEMRGLLSDLNDAENKLSEVRAQVADAAGRGQDMMRRIDNVTSAIYGVDDVRKAQFGLRPIDRHRDSPGPTPKVVGLRLSDGLGAGSIQADWKRIPRAVYEVRWFADAELGQLMGSAVSTRSELLIPGLAPGTQIWVQVRALRGRRQGEWSDSATRISNV